MANSNLRYVRGLTVPKTIGTGRKLMHNNVRHSVNMPTGVNGFRAWTDAKVPAGFIRCPCGWSGLPQPTSPAGYAFLRSWRTRSWHVL
jgi:hypothetical protein